MPEKVIVDASFLIALEKIGLSDILCKLYTNVILPEAVISEFGTPSINCYSVMKVESSLVTLFVHNLNLGKGEAEVISLAKETGLKVIMDDQKARKAAETLALHVTGTIGILLKAEKSGFIPSAYTKAKELKDKGFYVSEEILNQMSGPKIT